MQNSIEHAFKKIKLYSCYNTYLLNFFKKTHKRRRTQLYSCENIEKNLQVKWIEEENHVFAFVVAQRDRLKVTIDHRIRDEFRSRLSDERFAGRHCNNLQQKHQLNSKKYSSKNGFQPNELREKDGNKNAKMNESETQHEILLAKLLQFFYSPKNCEFKTFFWLRQNCN